MKGISKTNYWRQKVQYNSRTSVQNFLKVQKPASQKKLAVVGGDCSCNCFGDCYDGGSCSSCNYDGE